MSRTASPSAVSLPIDADALRQLVQVVVRETLAAVEAEQAKIPDDKLAYDEGEAAALLGVAQHVLRDARLEGKIVASRITGRRIRYARADLLKYLHENRAEPK